MSLNPQTLTTGCEQYEIFTTPGRMGRAGKKRCQYDYRHTNGKLFSCITPSVQATRERRDEWLKEFEGGVA